MTALRPYQQLAVAQIRNRHRPLLVAPTGSGKTLIAAEVICRAADSHVLMFAHRRELIHQARDKLKAFGVDAGIILAGEPRHNMRRVQVASIQTLAARCLRGDEDLPLADMVLIDESHHAPANTYRELVARYPQAKIIGMTATPCRRDGRGLGSLFDCLVETPQIPELISLGFLVLTKVFAPSKPNLKGVRTRAGDYVESQLAEAMDKAELVGDIVSHWHRLAERRKTVVFATSVAHSIHLKDEFVRSGVKAEHLDGSTPKDERDEILERLSAGDIELVTNCMVLTEGWDQPDVACCVLARPTKSMGLYRQMAGRVIRPSPGKEKALILDHAGATFAHGFVEDPVVWTLEEDDRATNPTHAKRTELSNRLLECTSCHAIRTAGEACLHCGFLPKRAGAYVAIREGELAHLDRFGSHPSNVNPQRRHEWHAMFVYEANRRGYKQGWAAVNFKEKFGQWPPRTPVDPIPPDPEVSAWIRHRLIAYAKGMQKAAANA